jgi:hypothetical protein
MASAKPGSQVVVCTDGLANVGLGAMDAGAKGGQEQAAVNEWYEGVGALAQLNGTAVSIVSIKGDECRLENVGRVAEITGGQVDRVDPLQLTNNFDNILVRLHLFSLGQTRIFLICLVMCCVVLCCDVM